MKKQAIKLVLASIERGFQFWNGCRGMRGESPVLSARKTVESVRVINSIFT